MHELTDCFREGWYCVKGNIQVTLFLNFALNCNIEIYLRECWTCRFLIDH